LYGLWQAKLRIVILLLNILSTFFMTGLICFVQIVHYPLFDTVGTDNFVNYETKHNNLTSYVVIVPMFVELLTSFLLILSRPDFIGKEVYLGAALVVIIWASTAFLQVPQHNILSNGFNDVAYQKLVSSNWLRTIAWLLRSILLSYWLYYLIKQQS